MAIVIGYLLSRGHSFRIPAVSWPLLLDTCSLVAMVILYLQSRGHGYLIPAVSWPWLSYSCSHGHCYRMPAFVKIRVAISCRKSCLLLTAASYSISALERQVWNLDMDEDRRTTRMSLRPLVFYWTWNPMCLLWSSRVLLFWRPL